MSEIIAILSDDQLRTLAQAGVIPHDTPAPVVRVFAQACREHGLSPFKKEIYLVSYNTRQGKQYHNIVGIDGLRTKAARTGQFAGRDDARYNALPDGSFQTAAQVKASGKPPVSCTVTVYRLMGGVRCPFTKTVLFEEYYPAAQSFSKAATMPLNMIEKCAEAAALRMAFADETAGLHIQEESAAIEDVTIQAANTTNPGASLDVEELKDRLQQSFTLEALATLYRSNPAHKAHAELFSARRAEIETLTANGQVQAQ
jgi:phage recombination protein Bet